MTLSRTGTRFMITLTLLIPLAGCGPFGSGQAAGREQILEYGTPTEFLTCSQPAAGATADTVIGPGGGILRAGGVTELSIPAGALRDERRIVLQQDTGQRVGITIQTEREQGESPALLRSATLRIDVSGCSAASLGHPSGWWVWRMNPEVPDSSQKLGTRITPREATTLIDSTSKFMIAH